MKSVNLSIEKTKSTSGFQAGGGMEPVCQERICSEDRSVWDPQTCQCGNHNETCEPGEQLYLDIFGQGVCGCKPGNDCVLLDRDG